MLLPRGTRARRPDQRTGGPARGSAWHRWGVAVWLAIFWSLAAAAIAAVVLLWPRDKAPTTADRTLEIAMAGFSQPVITARNGEPLRLQLANPDSPFHTDGGWHQLAVRALGLDFRIPPRSQQVVKIPGTVPGEYESHCDVCCSGKDNPTKRDVLRVEA